jgi:predicted nucleotidyltransferase
MEYPADLPQRHRAFLEKALAALEVDPRLAGVAAGGSFVTGGMDEFSDLDLVIAVDPASYDEVIADRRQIAAGLGNLLAAFTGEHVGEPRLLICLYGPTPLHVDLKFVRLDETVERVEDPASLLDRSGHLAEALGGGDAEYPQPDLQWIEDRFWIWIHYGVAKAGRGELFEAHDFLAYLRMQVLGPLALLASGAQPTGVRKIEALAPQYVDRLRATLASHDAENCLDALSASADLYVSLRDQFAPDTLIRGRSAQLAAMEYLRAIREDLRSS